jgi:Leucine-rich repeat (LRR) protein
MEELDLSNMKLTELPNEYNSMVSLKKLVLKNNNINIIDSDIINTFLLLEELDYSFNLIKILGKIKIVTVFELQPDGQFVRKNVENLIQLSLPKLVKLQLNNNKIHDETTSNINNTNFPLLEELNLNNNLLTMFKTEWTTLSTIKKLYLNNNYIQVKSIPIGIDGNSFPLLEEFDLSNNLINVIPFEWTTLSNLKILKLNNNQLTYIVFEIVYTELIYLDLSYNNIDFINSTFIMPKLEKLYLNNNKLTIDSDATMFMSTPTILTSLKLLDMSNNLFIRIPRFVFTKALGN